MKVGALLLNLAARTAGERPLSGGSVFSVQVDREALELLANAAGHRGVAPPVGGFLTIFGRELVKTEAPGAGFRVLAIDGSVLIEGELEP